MPPKKDVAAQLKDEELASISSPVRRSSRISINAANSPAPAALTGRRASHTEASSTPKLTKTRRLSQAQNEKENEEVKPVPRTRRASQLLEEVKESQTPTKNTRASKSKSKSPEAKIPARRGRKPSTATDESNKTAENKDAAEVAPKSTRSRRSSVTKTETTENEPTRITRSRRSSVTKEIEVEDVQKSAKKTTRSRRGSVEEPEMSRNNESVEPETPKATPIKSRRRLSVADPNLDPINEEKLEKSPNDLVVKLTPIKAKKVDTCIADPDLSVISENEDLNESKATQRKSIRLSPRVNASPDSSEIISPEKNSTRKSLSEKKSDEVTSPRKTKSPHARRSLHLSPANAEKSFQSPTSMEKQDENFTAGSDDSNPDNLNVSKDSTESDKENKSDETKNSKHVVKSAEMLPPLNTNPPIVAIVRTYQDFIDQSPIKYTPIALRKSMENKQEKREKSMSDDYEFDLSSDNENTSDVNKLQLSPTSQRSPTKKRTLSENSPIRKSPRLSQNQRSPRNASSPALEVVRKSLSPSQNIANIVGDSPKRKRNSSVPELVSDNKLKNSPAKNLSPKDRNNDKNSPIIATSNTSGKKISVDLDSEEEMSKLSLNESEEQENRSNLNVQNGSIAKNQAFKEEPMEVDEEVDETPNTEENVQSLQEKNNRFKRHSLPVSKMEDNVTRRTRRSLNVISHTSTNQEQTESETNTTESRNSKEEAEDDTTEHSETNDKSNLSRKSLERSQEIVENTTEETAPKDKRKSLEKNTEVEKPSESEQKKEKSRNSLEVGNDSAGRKSTSRRSLEKTLENETASESKKRESRVSLNTQDNVKNDKLNPENEELERMETDDMDELTQELSDNEAQDSVNEKQSHVNKTDSGLNLDHESPIKQQVYYRQENVEKQDSEATNISNAHKESSIDQDFDVNSVDEQQLKADDRRKKSPSIEKNGTDFVEQDSERLNIEVRERISINNDKEGAQRDSNNDMNIDEENIVDEQRKQDDKITETSRSIQKKRKHSLTNNKNVDLDDEATARLSLSKDKERKSINTKQESDEDSLNKRRESGRKESLINNENSDEEMQEDSQTSTNASKRKERKSLNNVQNNDEPKYRISRSSLNKRRGSGRKESLINNENSDDEDMQEDSQRSTSASKSKERKSLNNVQNNEEAKQKISRSSLNKRRESGHKELVVNISMEEKQESKTKTARLSLNSRRKSDRNESVNQSYNDKKTSRSSLDKVQKNSTDDNEETQIDNNDSENNSDSDSDFSDETSASKSKNIKQKPTSNIKEELPIDSSDDEQESNNGHQKRQTKKRKSKNVSQKSIEVQDEDSDDVFESESEKSLEDKISALCDKALDESEEEYEEEEEEERQDKNPFIDDMASEGEEDTPSEDSNEIIDEGESLHSTDSEYEKMADEDEYEDDSFVCDDEEHELLSGDEYDLGNEKKKKSKIIDDEGLTKKSRIVVVDSSSEDEVETMREELKSPPNKSSFEKADPVDKIKNQENDLNNSISSTRSKRKSSINIQENVRVDDIKDVALSERINLVLESFCSTITKGEISVNLSLDYAENGESSNEKEVDESSKIQIVEKSPNKRVSKSPTKIQTVEKSSNTKDSKSPTKIQTVEKSPNKKVSKSPTKIQTVETSPSIEEAMDVDDVENCEDRLSLSAIDLENNKSPKLKKRLSKSLENIAIKKKKNRSKKKKDKIVNAFQLKSNAELRADSFNLLNNLLVTDVKNRPKRMIKPSVCDPNSSWITEPADVKPSTSIITKREKKQFRSQFDEKKKPNVQLHEKKKSNLEFDEKTALEKKDFKTQMLYNGRIKRIDTKSMLKKKGIC